MPKVPGSQSVEVLTEPLVRYSLPIAYSIFFSIILVYSTSVMRLGRPSKFSSGVVKWVGWGNYVNNKIEVDEVESEAIPYECSQINEVLVRVKGKCDVAVTSRSIYRLRIRELRSTPLSLLKSGWIFAGPKPRIWDGTHHSRAFIRLPEITRKKEYYGKKLVGYSMEQMYDVVSDVDNYTKFVPFCKKSQVFLKLTNRMKANLVIGFPPIKESYVSDITLVRPRLVKAECTEGKLFDYLQTVWKFSPGLQDVEQSCVIDFFVSFEFRSLLHSQLAHIFFNEVVRQMENAFLDEASNRYGKASLKSRMLKSLPVNS
uniref:Coenzyme Q-binding protein COQ10 START domain-containing protein n=1 Tax=Timema poppense TaxID=170557 RepID=A0A7R9DK58_TIMPO|nr:unnamed protein product [Timema poppensis]